MEYKDFDNYFDELNNFFDDDELNSLLEHLKYIIKLMMNLQTRHKPEVFEEFEGSSVIKRIRPLIENERARLLHEHLNLQINKLAVAPSRDMLLRVFQETKENYLKRTAELLGKEFEKKIAEIE